MRATAWRWLGALTAVVAVAAMLGLYQGNQRRPVEIRFAAPERVRSAPLYVAMDKGYLAEEGVTLILTPFYTGREALAETLAGRQDVAASSGMHVVSAWAAGGKPAVLSSLAQSNLQAAIVTRGGVPADIHALRGRKVAILKGGTSELFLMTMLSAHGLTAADLDVVYLQDKAVVEALLAGQVDAASLWEPVLGEVLPRMGAQAGVIGNDGSFVDYWLVTASQPWLAANGDAAERLMRALVKAQAFIRSHPEEAREITLRRVPQDSKAWDDRIFRVRLDAPLVDTLKLNARAALGMTDPAGVAEVIHAEPLRAAAPGAVGIGR